MWGSLDHRAAVAALVGSLALPGSSLPHASSRAPADGPLTVRVSEADVTASNQKVAAAYGALVDMWSKEFQRVGARFVAPRIARYRGLARTACGIMQPSNASYCFDANTIYFDDVFLASQAKLAAAALHTDGDMSAVGIIAHEMGHAVAFQLGHRSRSSYENESIADCLAGAFAKQSQADGYLEAGDLDEAFFGLSNAGDPEIQSTGNPRMDRRIQMRLARAAHGTSEQRLANFREGLSGGGKACLAELD